MVKLNKKKKEKQVVEMKDLKDGQIAIVLKNDWYEGKIVQRYGDDAVSIGGDFEKGWPNINSNTLKVRILKKGEILTIFNNE